MGAGGGLLGRSACARKPAADQIRLVRSGDAAEIKAIACQIIPDDETPGAERAGVIWFIDRALAGYDQDKRSSTRAVWPKRKPSAPSCFRDSSMHRQPHQRAADPAAARRDRKDRFFPAGALSHHARILRPSQDGGNRGEVGWKLLGVEHSMQFSAAFRLLRRAGAQGRREMSVSFVPPKQWIS